MHDTCIWEISWVIIGLEGGLPSLVHEIINQTNMDLLIWLKKNKIQWEWSENWKKKHLT